MGYKTSSPEEILRKVLDISHEQVRLAEEGRVIELLRLQEERESLFKELKAGPGGEALKALAADILESDRSLSSVIEASMEVCRDKLKKVAKGSRAVKAYTAF